METHQIIAQKSNKDIKFELDSVGKVGRRIHDDIVKGLTDMIPIKSKVYIEVNILVEDNHLFKQDTEKGSKLIIEVDLENPKLS